MSHQNFELTADWPCVEECSSANAHRQSRTLSLLGWSWIQQVSLQHSSTAGVWIWHLLYSLRGCSCLCHYSVLPPSELNIAVATIRCFKTHQRAPVGVWGLFLTPKKTSSSHHTLSSTAIPHPAALYKFVPLLGRMKRHPGTTAGDHYVLLIPTNPTQPPHRLKMREPSCSRQKAANHPLILSSDRSPRS